MTMQDKKELKFEDMSSVVGGNAVGPVKETGPLDTCDPPNETGPLNWYDKNTGPLNYPY